MSDKGNKKRFTSFVHDIGGRKKTAIHTLISLVRPSVRLFSLQLILQPCTAHLKIFCTSLSFLCLFSRPLKSLFTLYRRFNEGLGRERESGKNGRAGTIVTAVQSLLLFSRTSLNSMESGKAFVLSVGDYLSFLHNLFFFLPLKFWPREREREG